MEDASETASIKAYVVASVSAELDEAELSVIANRDYGASTVRLFVELGGDDGVSVQISPDEARTLAAELTAPAVRSEVMAPGSEDTRG